MCASVAISLSSSLCIFVWLKMKFNQQTIVIWYDQAGLHTCYIIIIAGSHINSVDLKRLWDEPNAILESKILFEMSRAKEKERPNRRQNEPFHWHMNLGCRIKEDTKKVHQNTEWCNILWAKRCVCVCAPFVPPLLTIISVKERKMHFFTFIRRLLSSSWKFCLKFFGT